MSMEVHQLRYFVEVVQTGSFTKAAERCHVTQPTLSHQIKKLEETLGEPLLQRRRQGVRTTPLGQAFLARARSILAELRAAEEEAAFYAGDLKGSLRLGVIPTVAPYLMPRLVRASLRRFPALAFEITEDTTDNLLQAMRGGVLDACLLSLPVMGDEWKAEELMRDEILLALPPGHQLACGRKSVHPARLRGEALVLMKEAHCLRGQSLDICESSGARPEVYFTSSQIETLLAMVEAGFGLSFVPALARTAFRQRKVEFRPLAPQGVYRTLALVWLRQNVETRALQSFRKTCQEELRKKTAAKKL
jgi:LysR family hydrogen peroxide-inducible transcriptional activator